MNTLHTLFIVIRFPMLTISDKAFSSLAPSISIVYRYSYVVELVSLISWEKKIMLIVCSMHSVLYS